MTLMNTTNNIKTMKLLLDNIDINYEFEKYLKDVSLEDRICWIMSSPGDLNLFVECQVCIIDKLKSKLGKNCYEIFNELLLNRIT